MLKIDVSPVRFITICIASSMLLACGGGSDGSTPDKPSTSPTIPTKYTISGRTDNLKNEGLKLSDGLGNQIQISASATNFSFQNELHKTGDSYNIAIISQPNSQTCEVDNSIGTISNASVTNIMIRCQDNTDALIGSIVGDNQYPWNIQQPLNVNLFDETNHLKSIDKCESDHPEAVKLTPDCKQITLMRIGNYRITLHTSDGLSKTLNVYGVPARTPFSTNYASGLAQRLVTSDGQALVWGRTMGSYGYGSESNLGHIGINNADDVMTYEIDMPKYIVTGLDEAPIDNIYQISSGNRSTYLLDGKGSIWGMGISGYYNAPYNESADTSYPSEVNEQADILGTKGYVNIASGGNGKGIALKDDTTVYSFNTDFHESYLEPVKLADGSNLNSIKSVSADYEEFYAINNEGQVYTWKVGQKREKTTPKLIKKANGDYLSDIEKISTGSSHVLAMDNHGKVWVWGQNQRYEFGNPDYVNDYVDFAVPVLIDDDVKVIDIAAGFMNSFAVTSSGNVLAWGNKNASLGVKNTSSLDFVALPTYVVSETGIDILENVKAVTAKGRATFALKSDGTVWGWGGTREYNVLTRLSGEDTYSWTPIPMRGVNGKDVLKVDISAYPNLK